MKNTNHYLFIALVILSCVDLKAQEFFFSAERPSSCSSADGILTVVPTQGVPPFTYTWSDGTTKLSLKNIPKGTYSATLTDATGATVTHSHILNSETFDLYASNINPASYCNPHSGAITLEVVGGVAPYLYQWSDGQNTLTASGLLSGDYSVTVVDATGCRAEGAFTILKIDPYYVSARIEVAQSPTCSGLNEGGLYASMLSNSYYSPFTYTWSNGETTDTLQNLSAGTYGVTITDALGCYDTTQCTLQNELTTQGSVICSGGNTGTASALLVNATAPVEYTWSNGASGASIANLTHSNYEVTATDANGCNSEGIAAVIVPRLHTYDLTPDCYTGIAGAATVWTQDDNALSYLWSNGSTEQRATGLSPGIQYVTVTTGLGCTLSTSVIILPSAATPYSINTNITAANCANGTGGALNINITGGLGPHEFYAYSPNGFFSSSTAAMQNLTAGTYFLRISSLSLNHCYSSKTVVVTDQGGFEPELVADTTNCAPNLKSAAVVNVPATGVQYQWSTGHTSPDIHNLTPGTYTVTVTGSGSCLAYLTTNLSSNDSFLYTPLCFGFAKGTLIHDLGVPGCSGTAGLPFQLIRTQPSGALNFTDKNGVFEIPLPNGMFDLEPASYNLDDIACPAGGFHSVHSVIGETNDNLDFHFFNTNTNDFRIRQRALRTAQPGYPYSLRVEVCNDGSATFNGGVDFSHANFLGSVLNHSFSQNPGAFTLTSETSGNPNNVANFTFNSILPSGCELLQFDFEIPTTTPVNTEFETVARVEPLVGDPTPDNNITTQQNTVVGSFDPNSVLAFPARNGNPRDGGTIFKNVDNRIKYQIFFQNLGTAPADLVVIRDTMDSKLVLSSIQNIQSSHEVKISIEGAENNILVFTFANIHLSDATSDYANSIGSVSYDIDLQQDLPLGVTVSKQAAIYFDFNPPIMTNQNRLSLVDSTYALSPDLKKGRLHIFPNPAQAYMGIYTRTAGEIRVYSAIGALIAQQSVETGLHQIPTLNWPNGVYFVQLDMGTSIQHGKVVVSH